MILKSFIKDSYLVSLSQILLTPYGTQTADLSDQSLGPYMRVQKNGLIRVTVTHQVRVRLSVLAELQKLKLLKILATLLAILIEANQKKLKDFLSAALIKSYQLRRTTKMKQFVSKQFNMFAKQSKKSVLPVLCDISISAIPADHIGAGKEWERKGRFKS